ncbi:MAG: hypothetical protein KDI01_11515 [Halioglobus sp.]|nr:hypothetical protein [Halioglobus sp.]
MRRHALCLFTIAALFNFAVGLSWILAWSMVQNMLLLAPSSGSNRLITLIAAVLILTFGYAYWRAGRAPEQFRAYIHLGVVGKLLVVAAALPTLFAATEGYLLAWLAMGDLCFAMLFVHFLKRYPAEPGTLAGGSSP